MLYNVRRKTQNGQAKHLHKKDQHFYNNCYELRSRASKHAEISASLFIYMLSFSSVCLQCNFMGPNMKLNGKNVEIQMTNLMLNCLFLTSSNVRLFQLYGTDYNFGIHHSFAGFVILLRKKLLPK